MKKEKLIEFINTYNLNGLCEGIVWNISDKSIKVAFMAEDSTVLGKVKYNGIDIKDSVFGIKTTSALRKKLTQLSDEIEVKEIIINNDNEPVNIHIKDLNSTKKAVHPLCDTSDDIIDNLYPKEINFPDTTIKIPVDSKFISEFNSCKNALDVNHLSFMTENDIIKVVFGYDNDNNVDTMEFETTGEIIDTLTPASFNSDTLKAIFSNNANFKSCELKISQDEDGDNLMIITIVSENYVCEYVVPGLIN
jgi:hypothetical protein